MGLTRWVARAAAKRVHVMVVEDPRSAPLRMRAEAAVTSRGWVTASSPADTDALLVCGEPSSQLCGLIDAVWEQVPAPRVRATVTDAARLTSTMNDIADDLRDTGMQRRRAEVEQRRRHMDAAIHTEHSGHEGGHSGHEAEHSGRDMEMTGPGGIPLAEGSLDRDGLEMDATHLTLGPLLPDWPAMLALHCTLHGDVVTEADVEWFIDGEPPMTSAREDAALLAESTARVLAVAGWDPLAARVRRLRNEILGDVPLRSLGPRLATLSSRIRRSKVLQWSAQGLPVTGTTSLQATLQGWLAACATILEAGRPTGDEHRPLDTSVAAESIRAAVIGHELSTVRLIVASLGVEHSISRAPVSRG